MKHLSRTLAAIVLAAPLGGCLIPGTHCGDNRQYEDTVDLPDDLDANTAEALASCRMDPADMFDCGVVCQAEFDSIHVPETLTFSTCELVTDPETGKEAAHYVGRHQCVGGRRPHGYRGGRACAPSAVGAYLAQQAALEHASVRAFHDLLADLVALGAPAPLRARVIRAAADEVRHARTCDALARRHGTAPRYAAIAPARRRSLAEVARDNAVEGCVRETYGAAVAAYQARAAHDPAIRAAMRTIARDETSHAALSWGLHRWAMRRLPAAERRAIADAMRAARAELAPVADHADVHRIAGIPAIPAARAILDGLDARVFG